MVRWGFLKLNEFQIDAILDQRQKDYLIALTKKDNLTKDSTDEEIKAVSKELYQAIINFHNNRTPDGLLDAT